MLRSNFRLFPPGSAGRFPAGLTPASIAVLATVLTPSAGAQVVKEDFWVVHGQVNAIAVSGSTIYVGGAFSSVGPPSGGGVPLSSVSGAAVGTFPKVAGSVWAVASDGAGGWFVGGRFNAIGGQPRVNLGHVLADGNVAAWNPGSSAQVLGIAVSGSTVYAAAVGGALAFDAATGAPLGSWNPPSPYGGLFTIAADGSRVYLGGFSGYLAALDAVTGAAVWNQDLGFGGSPTVYTLAVSGSTLYVGGRFASMGGQPRTRIAALDAATGAVNPWNPGANNNVYSLAVDGSTVYAGGIFTSIGGQPRNRIAALDATSGAATSWDPGASSAVYSLAVAGSTVFAGGSFTTIGGQARGRLAALDATSGAVSSWNPNADFDVRALRVSGTTAFAGGVFSCMGNWLGRSNLAALDATTGQATDWNPAATGGFSSVGALEVDGSTIYVGGAFTNVGGQARNNIAALDAATGAATAWDPNADQGVSQILVGGSTVYVAGRFFNIGGQSRNRIAALDAGTGAATAWNPNSNDDVNRLAASGGVVYAAGYFSNIGGRARTWLAALDASTGAATPWNASPAGDWVSSLSTDGAAVYAGGRFSSMGGQPRSNVAALDPTTGAALAWDPGSDDEVAALAIDDATVYVGGVFASIDGQARSSIAAIDAATGDATDWDPNDACPTCSENARPSVYALVVSGGTVYIGGSFDNLGNSPRYGFAAVSQSTVNVPESAGPRSLELAQCRPNPAGASTFIEFTLPTAAPVTLGVFDVQGRRVASLLEGETRPAGANRVSFRPAGLASGLYLYRLEALGRSASRKLIVVE